MARNITIYEPATRHYPPPPPPQKKKKQKKKPNNKQTNKQKQKTERKKRRKKKKEKERSRPQRLNDHRCLLTQTNQRFALVLRSLYLYLQASCVTFLACLRACVERSCPCQCVSEQNRKAVKSVSCPVHSCPVHLLDKNGHRRCRKSRRAIV